MAVRHQSDGDGFCRWIYQKAGEGGSVYPVAVPVYWACNSVFRGDRLREDAAVH